MEIHWTSIAVIDLVLCLTFAYIWLMIWSSRLFSKLILMFAQNTRWFTGWILKFGDWKFICSSQKIGCNCVCLLKNWLRHEPHLEVTYSLGVCFRTSREWHPLILLFIAFVSFYHSLLKTNLLLKFQEMLFWRHSFSLYQCFHLL